MPNFARACGRVSIGGHPDKRPDSRLRKWSHFLAHAIGSRRRTGAPRSPRGTRLKATTERAFLGPPARVPDHRRGLSILPGVRNGSFSLIRTKAAIDVMLGAHCAGRSHHRRFTQAAAPPCRIGRTVAMTARIREFLKQRKDEGPCLVVDLDVVRENYQLFAKALPDTRVFYAVKANPAPEILKLLAEMGSCFDVASVSETQAVLAAGASPDRISHGNTIKKESEIRAVAALGVALFAVDCEAEVEKVARC